MTPAKYRTRLPQNSGKLFLTDAGLETCLIYRDHLELPSFAAFVLLQEDKGQQTLQKYFSTYAELAKKYETGVILETPTWRASRDWGGKLGIDESTLTQLNERAVRLLQDVRAEFETPKNPIVVSGCIGPRGDGYVVDKRMNAEDAETYHEFQVRAFDRAGVDAITAVTMTYPEEAIGIVWAARSAKIPVIISFTVETDGRLPCGLTLQEAIQEVDAATDNAPEYFMINCAHPQHFEKILQTSEPWTKRLRGMRVNASHKSHAELDQATELDAGDPTMLAQDCFRLRAQNPQLTILGGCCGTDERHVEELAKAAVALPT